MTRPEPEEVLDRLVARGTLTPEQVQTAALDVLDFVTRSLDAGMIIGVRMKGSRRWNPVQWDIAGLTTALEDPE